MCQFRFAAVPLALLTVVSLGCVRLAGPSLEETSANSAREEESVPNTPPAVAAILTRDLPALTYLANPDFAKELQIDPAQQAALAQLVDDFFREWLALQEAENRLAGERRDNQGRNAATILEARKAIVQQSGESAQKILTPAQTQHFHELLFQFRGVEFLLEPEVRQTLALSNEEIVAIHETRIWVAESGNKIKLELQGKSGKKRELTRRFVALRQDAWTRLETHLSSQTRDKLAIWRGAPAQFEEYKLNLQIQPSVGLRKAKTQPQES